MGTVLPAETICMLFSETPLSQYGKLPHDMSRVSLEPPKYTTLSLQLVIQYIELVRPIADGILYLG